MNRTCLSLGPKLLGFRVSQLCRRIIIYTFTWCRVPSAQCIGPPEFQACATLRHAVSFINNNAQRVPIMDVVITPEQCERLVRRKRED